MNSLFIRITAIFIHAILNFMAVTYFTGIDITGSWLTTIGFVLFLFVLFYLFVKHILSFITFIKTK